MKNLCVLLAVCLLFGLSSRAFADGGPQTEVRSALAKFVQAFDNLEWEKFRACFADNATIFHPRQFSRRVAGTGVDDTFKQVFARIKGEKSNPPYMDLQPKDLQIQFAGNDVAIATFHLDDRPGLLNRRTIVLQKIKGSWKIIHIHASEVVDTPMN